MSYYILSIYSTIHIKHTLKVYHKKTKATPSILQWAICKKMFQNQW
jgi:hypothetical protein